MTDNHPITVPAGSITGWKTLYRKTYQGDLSETEYIATEAARWGADQELEACCEWLETGPYGFSIEATAPSMTKQLRTARRPKPPSLKEQALDELDLIPTHDNEGRTLGADVSIIRRALQELPND
jgi:hypothetical protein